MTWSQLLLRWASSLPRVQQQTSQWDAERERFCQSDDFRANSWAQKLHKLHPDRFNSIEQYVGMLSPALEMVLAMIKCTTPVQKVRLWTESILQAASLINTFLPNGQEIGAEDMPSLVLFLTCHAECEQLAAQVEFTRLFIVDPDGFDREEFGLHRDSGFAEQIGEQIVLDAEIRCILPTVYFLWVGDALDVVTNNLRDDMSPRSRVGSPRSCSSSASASRSLVDEDMDPSSNLDAVSPLTEISTAPDCGIDEAAAVSEDAESDEAAAVSEDAESNCTSNAAAAAAEAQAECQAESQPDFGSDEPQTKLEEPEFTMGMCMTMGAGGGGVYMN